MVLLQFWLLIITFGTSIWGSEIRYEVDEIANDLRTITFLIRFFSIRIPRRMIFEVHEIANDLRTITFLIRFFSIRIPRCMIFAKCLHDACWILIFFFFFEFFGGANLFSIFDSCTEIYDFSEMFARCILDPYLLCFEFSVLQICSILKSIHVSVLSEAFSS